MGGREEGLLMVVRHFLLVFIVSNSPKVLRY